jgi:protein SCO1/2
MKTASFGKALLLAAVALGLFACDGGKPQPTFETTDITGVEWGRDFRLVDHTGTRRSVADFRGKAVLMFFGYANCPDMCPIALAKMAQAVEQLGDDGKRVQGLFVTLDPARDTSSVLASYVTAFHPSFLGLREAPENIAATAKEFKVFHAAQETKDQGAYMVDRSAAMFAFDPKGRLRLYMNAETPVDAIVNDVKTLLEE